MFMVNWLKDGQVGDFKLVNAVTNEVLEVPLVVTVDQDSDFEFIDGAAQPWSDGTEGFIISLDVDFFNILVSDDAKADMFFGTVSQMLPALLLERKKNAKRPE